jgi:threonine/homoserine/homoserine lactone efflux protein
MITFTFVLASFALLIAPGPNVVFIITQAITHGRKAGLMCMLGGISGVLVITVLVALGLASLLAASELAFNIVKWAGAAYLIYMGVRTLLDRNAIQFEQQAGAYNGRRLFRQGMITSMLNPKLAVFFVAFLPQFVNPEAGNVTLQLLALGGTFAAIGVLSDGAYAMLAGTFGEWLRRQPVTARVLSWVAGCTFIVLGARLAFERR